MEKQDTSETRQQQDSRNMYPGLGTGFLSVSHENKNLNYFGINAVVMNFD